MGLVGRCVSLMLVVSLAACDEPTSDAEVHTLAGKLDADTYVALVADDRDVVLYVCDGDADSVAVTAWFTGAHADGSFDLTSEQTAGRAVGTLSADGAEGSVTLGGQALSFTAEPAAGPAGLYFDQTTDADATTFWGGWIVQADGGVRGSVLNRKTNSIVAAGNATPNAALTVLGLQFKVTRLTRPRL